MTNYVKKLLEAAQSAGYKITVGSEGEVDYDGFNAAEALKAVDALDEADVSFEENGSRRGTALIVNGLAEDERIADTSGHWVEAWWDRVVRPEVVG